VVSIVKYHPEGKGGICPRASQLDKSRGYETAVGGSSTYISTPGHQKG